MISIELFTPSSELFIASLLSEMYSVNKHRIDANFEQHFRDIEDVMFEFAKNGYVVTDEIQAIIDLDILIYPSYYNKELMSWDPDNAFLMRLTLSNPEANAKFILNNGILISGDILVCEEEEILYKNLKLIGDNEYYNEKLQKFEFIYFYQCTRTYKMYQISGAIDGCKNICCLTASPISYDELKQKCIWRYYHIYINLQYERRKYIISNID